MKHFLWMFTELWEDVKFVRAAETEGVGFRAVFLTFMWVFLGIALGPPLLLLSGFLLDIRKFTFLILLWLFGTFARWLKDGLWDALGSSHMSGGEFLSLCYSIFWSALIYMCYFSF